MRKRGANSVGSIERSNMSHERLKGLSDLRRGQITDAANKEQDESLNKSGMPTPAIVRSGSFNKQAMPGPVQLPGTTGQTGNMGPEIYSPLFQIANLNLPRDKNTTNAWCRVFYDTHPIVRNCINLHSSFPISKINITCKNSKVQDFFLEMAERIDLYSIVYGVAIEFWKIGEVFPYAELDRENNTWKRITVLNPDFINVSSAIIGSGTTISMQPDAGLKRLISSTNPSDVALKAKIPKNIIDLVRKGHNIPLDKYNISHLKLLSSPYDTRGTSIIVSIFKDLMLYDKIREAKLAQADGMINPLTLATLGDGAEYRPTQADIDAHTEMLEQAQYNKDFKIVTHSGFKIERVGFSGGTLEVGADLEFINQNIYTGLMVPKSLTDQEGSCLSVADNEILTERGWVKYDDLNEEDKIGTVNPETHALEFHKPISKTDYEFSGMMFHFKNQEVDVKVTDFHEMYLSDDNGISFRKERALSVFNVDDINCEEKFDSRSKKNVRFKTTIDGWRGTDAPGFVVIPDAGKSKGSTIPLDDYLELMGYYLSEGHLRRRMTGNKTPASIEITQQPYSKGYSAMSELFSRLPYNAVVTGEKNNRRGWNICNGAFARYIFNDCGEKSYGKRIPVWAKQLPPEKLNILLHAMMLGDGHFLKNSSSHSGSYTTICKQLADDVQEIAFKCGYATNISICDSANIVNPKHHVKYKVKIFKNDLSQRGPMRKSKPIVKPTDTTITWVEKERVFCVEVPNHVFVTRSNDKIAIHGNSYASASVGLEVLRQRYDIFRNMIKKWLEQKIFAPICELNDFFEYVDGKKKLIIPVVDFNHMNLYDIDSYVSTIGNYVGSKDISLQTLYRSLGLNKEEERRRLREEAIEKTIFDKELEILAKMRLSELHNLDPDKAIVEPPEETSEVTPDMGDGESGGDVGEELSLPGMSSEPAAPETAAEESPGKLPGMP